MKKIILAVFLMAGAASLNAATHNPFQQDTSKHKMHKKSSSDTGWHKKSGGKMKKDSMK